MKTLFTTTILAAAVLVSSYTVAETPVAGREVIGVSVTEAVTNGYRASKIIGMEVKNADGQTVGTVDDLIIASDDFVGHAIISVGGFLGMGAKHVAVPVEDIKDIRGRAVLPDATKGRLERLPEFHYAMRIK